MHFLSHCPENVLQAGGTVWNHGTGALLQQTFRKCMVSTMKPEGTTFCFSAFPNKSLRIASAALSEPNPTEASLSTFQPFLQAWSLQLQSGRSSICHLCTGAALRKWLLLTYQETGLILKQSVALAPRKAAWAEVGPKHARQAVLLICAFLMFCQWSH